MLSPAPRIDSVMTPAPHVIRGDATIAEAHHQMRVHRIRHLPVMQGGSLVGVLSERDVYWIESQGEAACSSRLVADAMTPFPYFVAPDAPLAKVASEMAGAKFGAAIV